MLTKKIDMDSGSVLEANEVIALRDRMAPNKMFVLKLFDEARAHLRLWEQ